MANQKITIVDIARKAGLSITTVSRVLNGKAEEYRISRNAQEKIKETAKELNYVPNQFAANLKSGKSNTIALIIPSLNNPFFAGIASDITFEVRKHGYITIIGDSDENEEIERRELAQIMSRNVEGLIIAPSSADWEPLKQLHQHRLPIVCIDRYFESLDIIPYVSTDHYDGAYKATKYLIENGHKNIACIQGHPSTPNKKRIKGFQDAMSEAGIDNTQIVGNEFSVQNGYLESKLLVQKKNRPTAIFTLSNTIAMGCMKALKEENMAIPDDISLITFDDHPYLDYLATPLSCIMQPVSSICKIAVKFLFSMLNDEEAVTGQILLKPEMVYRDSVKRIS